MITPLDGDDPLGIEETPTGTCLWSKGRRHTRAESRGPRSIRVSLFDNTR